MSVTLVFSIVDKGIKQLLIFVRYHRKKNEEIEIAK